MEPFTLAFALAVSTAAPSAIPTLHNASPGYCEAPGITPPKMLPVPSTHRTYPPQAVRKNEEGNTILDYRIDELGKVQDVKVAQSSGFADLDDAATTSVLTEAFTPATLEGKPVACRRLERMVWKLTDDPGTTPFLNVFQMKAEDFPAQAKAKGEQGTVLVAAVIDENGKIINSAILHSSGFGDLDAASLDRVYASKGIIPARLDGRAVSSTAIIEFCWTLGEAANTPAPPRP
jgi:TonB family protein